MKQVVVVGLWLVLGLGMAAAYTEFEAGLIGSSQQLAQLVGQVSSAEKRLQVLEQDPYAAPLEREEAAASLARVRIQLGRQRLALRQEAYRLWTEVLNGRVRLEAARAAAKVAELRLRAARVRAEKGAASPLELDAAGRAYERAVLQLEQARAALDSARQALAARSEVDPDAVPEVVPPEALDVERHPDLQQARLDVQAAERAVLAASGPDTARLEKEKRAAELRAARERAERLRERLRRELESLQAQYARQQRLVGLARDAVADAQKKLEAQRLRLEHGLASELDVLSAEQELAQARADRLSAQVELGRLALELWAYAEAP